MACLDRFTLMKPCMERHMMYLFVHPELYVTVIGECGSTYFRSGQNPKASRFARTRSVRVLLQEIVLTRGNLMAVAERLYDALNAYEDDFVTQRKRDDVFAAAYPPTAAASGDEESSSDLVDSSTTQPSKPESDAPEHNIFRTIDYALLALDLLPKDCLPVMVLITDGVTSDAGTGEQLGQSVLRRIVRDNVIFSAIQVGSTRGFDPGVNYGHVPDNELLRFVAVSSLGRILYSSDCKYLDADASQPPTEEIQPPNFYHRQLLFRDRHFAKELAENRFRLVHTSGVERPIDIPRARLINTGVGIHEVSKEELRYPWVPHSRPPLVAEILCGYRDYAVTIPIQHLVFARLQEGFALKTIHVTHKTGRPSKVEVILAKSWLPNVTIHYTIKTVWVDKGKHFLAAEASNKHPRIELNILAHHSFAILFINVQSFEEKNAYLHTMHDKIMKLHAYLKSIYESDDLFKVISSFNSKYALSSIPVVEQRLFHLAMDSPADSPPLGGRHHPASHPSQTPNTSDSSSNYWQVLSQIVAMRSDLFAGWSCDLILRSTSTATGVGGIVAIGRPGVEGARTRPQVATIYLTQYLAGTWASFALGKTGYVKLVHGENGAEAPTGFCLLRVTLENECLSSIRVSFFNVAWNVRRGIVDGLVAAIGGIEHTARSTGATFHPLVVCRKPVHKLLVRYRAGKEDDDGLISRESLANSVESGKGSPPATPTSTVAGELGVSTAQLISDPAIRAYLRNRRWIWLSDVPDEDLDYDRTRVPLHELAFLLLYRHRLEEGFLLVSEMPGSVTLYREALLRRKRISDERGDSSSVLEDDDCTVCTIQFVITKDQINQNVVTELWVEPLVDGSAGSGVFIEEGTKWTVITAFREHYNLVSEKIIRKDQRLIARLYTFDRIHALGRAGGGSLLNTPTTESRPRDSMIPTEFHLPSVLHGAPFSTVAYHFPEVSDGDVVEPVMGLFGSHLAASAPSSGVTPASPHSLGAESPSVRSDRTVTPSVTHQFGALGGTPLGLTRASSQASQPYLRGTSTNELSTSVPSLTQTDLVANSAPVSTPGHLLGMEAVFMARTRRERTHMILHRFFDRALGLLADGEIHASNISELNVHDEDRDLLDIVRKAVESQFENGKEFLTGHIADSRCFVKIRNPQSFMLVFLPTYPILSTLARQHSGTSVLSDAPADENGAGATIFRYIAVTVVECTRPTIYPSEPLSSLAAFAEPDDASESDSAAPGMEDGIRISVVNAPGAGDSVPFSDGSVIIEGGTKKSTDMNGPRRGEDSFSAANRKGTRYLSEYAQQFLTNLSTGFASAFAKCVYASLLQGQCVTAADFDYAIGACKESSIDIDITGYLNVRALLRQKSETWDQTDVQHRFREALAKRFDSVSTYIGEERNVYFYRPTVAHSLPSSQPPTASTSDTVGPKAPPTPIAGPIPATPIVAALGQQLEALARLLECSDSPLLVRTECSFRKPNLSDAEHTQIPILALPESYQLPGTAAGNPSPRSSVTPTSGSPESQGLDDNMDFAPRGIGTDRSPIESSDGTRAILHIICLTLPRLPVVTGGDISGSEYEDVPSPDFDRTPRLGAMRDSIHWSPHLDLDPGKQAALRETVADIEMLLEDEIMHGLLMMPIEDRTFRYVESTLCNRHRIGIVGVDLGPGRSKPTSPAVSPMFVADEIGASLAVNLPLAFVKPGVGSDLFLSEFQRAGVAGFYMKRIENGFYLETLHQHEAESLAPDTKVKAAQKDSGRSDVSDKPSYVIECATPPDVVGESEASLQLPQPTPVPLQTEEKRDSPYNLRVQTGLSESQRQCWVIVTVTGSTVQLYVFSKAVTGSSRLGIVRAVRHAVTECCERVNKLILLKELSESHTASKYLIPPVLSEQEGEQSDSSEEASPGTSPDADLAQRRGSVGSLGAGRERFPLGRFSCSLVFRHAFPVHWRVRPQQALNAVVIALHPLAINNRRNMFVFAARGSVFYMRLSIEEIEESEPSKEKDSTDAQSTATREDKMTASVTSAAPSQLESPKISSPTVRRATPASITSGGPSGSGNNPTAPASSSRSEHALILEVFGIDSPGIEITKEFVTLVESKLNAVTLQVLSTFLARNVTIKLSPADVDIILPVGRRIPCARREWHCLPATIRSPYIFLLLLRQSLLFYLHPLGGVEVVSALRNYYETHFGWGKRVSEGVERRRSAYELQVADFSFLYNCLPTRNPTAIEAAIGQGIAAICLALLDEEGRVVAEAPGFEFEDDSNEFDEMAEERLGPVFTSRYKLADDVVAWDGYKIVVEVWTQGSINLDALFDRIGVAFRETSMDYVVEVAARVLVSGANQKAPPMDDPLGIAGISDVASVGDTNHIASSLQAEPEETEQPSTPLVDTGRKNTGAWRIEDGFSKFINTVSATLHEAAETKVPTVQELVSEIGVSVQTLEDFASEIQDVFNETSPLLVPLTLKRKDQEAPDGDHRAAHFEVCDPSTTPAESLSESQTSQPAPPDMYVVVAGLRELNARFGPLRPVYAAGNDWNERKSSFGSDSSGAFTPAIQQSHARRGSAEESMSETGTTTSLPVHYRRASRAYSNSGSVLGWSRSQMDDLMFFPGNLHPAAFELGSRSCFVVASIENSQLTVYTYNWNRPQYDLLFGKLLRLLSWNNILTQFLEKQMPTQTLSGGSSLSRLPSIGPATVHNSYGGDMMGAAKLARHMQQRGSGLPTVGESVGTPADVRTRLQLLDAGTLPRQAVDFMDAFVRTLVGGLSTPAPPIRTNTDSAAIKGGLPLIRKTTESGSSSSLATHAHVEDKTPLLSPSYIAHILRSVRLLHHVRYPLLFTELRDQVFNGQETRAVNNKPEIAGEFAVPERGNAGPVIATSVAEEALLKWHRDLVETFMREYSAYLAHVGMMPVAQSKSDVGGTPTSANAGAGSREIPGPSTPRYEISRRLWVEKDALYFKRIRGCSALIAQVGLDGLFVCINLYTIRTATTDLLLGASAQRAKGPEVDRTFEAECDRMRSLLHLNSFAYDFHLRNFQTILENKKRDAGAPDVLSAMKAFARFNSRKATFARSRFYHGVCVTVGANASTSLFQYILKNPQRYGFLPVLHDGNPTACYFSSTMPDFNKSAVSKPSTEGDNRTTYTLVVYPSSEAAPQSSQLAAEKRRASDEVYSLQVTDQTRHHHRSGSAPLTNLGRETGTLTIRYFLLILEREKTYPFRDVEDKGASAMGPGSLYDPLHEYLGGGYYLKDIVKNAEREIEGLMQKAIRYYGRDSLWRQLMRSEDPASQMEPTSDQPTPTVTDGIHEWTKMFLEKIAPNSRSLLSIDSDLVNLFGDPSLPWVEILEHLREVFGKEGGARGLVERADTPTGNDAVVGKRHLILFNPQNRDYLLHLVVWPGVAPDGSSDSLASDGSHDSRQEAGAPSPVKPKSPSPLTTRTSELVSLGARAARLGEYQCDAFAVSREGVPDQVEYAHVSNVVNVIGRWLWRWVARRNGVLQK
ncbi:KICSTOR complex protein szt2 [Borealophlyctis nickersoniae]|nr:KICSTOR complex protein szt2 [Borealophlyctis nickersoniae]